MSSFQKIARLSAVAAAVVVAAPAFAAATFDANAEFNNVYQNQSRGISQSGRVEFNAAGRAEANGGFVAGRGTVLIGKDGGAAVDDAWVQVGTAAFDVKLGRFEAADTWPVGMDVIVERAGSGSYYHGTHLRGRFTGNEFHAAGTANFGGGLSFELGVAQTKDLTTNTSVSNSTGQKAKGVRPVLTYSANGLTIKAVVESGKTIDEDHKLTGFGGTVGFEVGGGTINVNLASGKVKDDVTGVSEKSNNVGVTTVFGPLGFVVDYAKNEDEKILTTYAAYSIPLFGIKGASVIPAASYSRAKNANGVAGVSQNSAGLNIRLRYDF